MRQTEACRDTGEDVGCLVSIGNERVGHVVFEEHLHAETLAEVVVAGEVDVHFVLTCGDLAVTLVDASQCRDVSSETDVEL